MCSADCGAHWGTAGGRRARRSHIRLEASGASSRTPRRCARRRLQPFVPVECAAFAGESSRRAASSGEWPPTATPHGPALPTVLHGCSLKLWPSERFTTSEHISPCTSAGQYLADTVGKHGVHYKRHSYICICDSAAVDSVNHTGDGFQDLILRPGNTYHMTSIFRLRTLTGTE